MVRYRVFVMLCVLGLLGSSWRGAGAAGQLDDATILAIYDQANTADILTGRLAAKYGESEDVRALGRRWPLTRGSAADGARFREEARGDSRRRPRATAASWTTPRRWRCCSRSAGGVRLAYLQHEVSFHQAVIDAIKGTLLPAAANPELRTLMTTVLPGFEHHLAATRPPPRRSA